MGREDESALVGESIRAGVAAELSDMRPETIWQRHGEHAAHVSLHGIETADQGRDLVSEREEN
jgi:hypothetical protein